MHRQKKQSTPRRRARKNEDDGSLHFLHRQPESGLILHRSFVIYDGGRPPVSKGVDLGGPNRKLRHGGGRSRDLIPASDWPAFKTWT